MILLKISLAGTRTVDTTAHLAVQRKICRIECPTGCETLSSQGTNRRTRKMEANVSPRLENHADAYRFRRVAV